MEIEMTKLFERLRLERLAIADTSRERYKNQKGGTNKSCWYFSALTEGKNTTNNAELCDSRQVVSLPWPSKGGDSSLPGPSTVLLNQLWIVRGEAGHVTTCMHGALHAGR